jgi:hypothetical protein
MTLIPSRLVVVAVVVLVALRRTENRALPVAVLHSTRLRVLAAVVVLVTRVDGLSEQDLPAAPVAAVRITELGMQVIHHLRLLFKVTMAAMEHLLAHLVVVVVREAQEEMVAQTAVTVGLAEARQ